MRMRAGPRAPRRGGRAARLTHAERRPHAALPPGRHSHHAAGSQPRG